MRCIAFPAFRQRGFFMASGCFVRRFFVSRFPLVWFRLDGRRRLHTSLLPRCGVACDSYELSDIVDPRVGDYSVYVLPNAFSLSDGEKAAIARLARGSERTAKRILELLADGPVRPSALRKAVGIRSPIHFSRYYLTPLMEKGMIERTDPDSPKSPRQEYKLA